MKKLKYSPLLAVATLLTCSNSVSGSEKFSAKPFAGSDGLLDRSEAALYIAHRDKEPLSKFLAPGQTQLDSAKMVTVLADKLDDLRSETEKEAPWKWQELDAAFPTKPSDAEAEAALPGWKKVEGLTKVKKLGEKGESGALGPIRLRKSAADLIKSDLKDARGATLGFSDNKLLNGGGAWNTEGALQYPIKWFRQGGPGQSLELEMGPAVEWKLAETQEKNAQDVEELTISAPFTAYISPGGQRRTGSYQANMTETSDQILSRLWVLQGKPYFQTDFSGGHEILGAQASGEFVGGLPGTSLYIGGFQNLGGSPLQYQLRLIPALDFSTTERVGIHSTRKDGDDWLRVGGTASFNLRIGAQSYNPLDVGVSYQLMENLDGDEGSSHLLKVHATWWLSENTGLTFEYTKGETPVATKNIDLFTIGLELKY